MLLDKMIELIYFSLSKLGKLSVFLLIFSQVFGIPTEISIPIIFSIYRDIVTYIIAVVSDVCAAIAVASIFKIPFKVLKKIPPKMISKKELFVLRMLPIIRGMSIFGIVHMKTVEIIPILLVTSAVWIAFLSLIPINVQNLIYATKKIEPYLLLLSFLYFVSRVSSAKFKNEKRRKNLGP